MFDILLYIMYRWKWKPGMNFLKIEYYVGAPAPHCAYLYCTLCIWLFIPKNYNFQKQIFKIIMQLLIIVEWPKIHFLWKTNNFFKMHRFFTLMSVPYNMLSIVFITVLLWRHLDGSIWLSFSASSSWHALLTAAVLFDLGLQKMWLILCHCLHACTRASM